MSDLKKRTSQFRVYLTKLPHFSYHVVRQRINIYSCVKYQDWLTLHSKRTWYAPQVLNRQDNQLSIAVKKDKQRQPSEYPYMQKTKRTVFVRLRKHSSCSCSLGAIRRSQSNQPRKILSTHGPAREYHAIVQQCSRLMLCFVITRGCGVASSRGN